MKKPTLFAPLADIKKPPKEAMFFACSVGHKTHERMLVQRDLIGQPKNLAAPAISPELGLSLKYAIYNWREYFISVDGNETVSEHGKYCTGQDIISYSIDTVGIWEGDETLTILDILAEGNVHNVVLDVGSHVGYYTMLAAAKGYNVAALDASVENLELLDESAKLNDLTDKVHPYLCWLDEDVPILPADAEGVQLMKVDIEGAEAAAVTMASSLFAAKKVKYCILEVSPVFNESYPFIVETIADWGYDVYQLPGNNWEHNEEFAVNPLATLKKYCEVPADGRQEYVASLHQENFLFVRREHD